MVEFDERRRRVGSVKAAVARRRYGDERLDARDVDRFACRFGDTCAKSISSRESRCLRATETSLSTRQLSGSPSRKNSLRTSPVSASMHYLTFHLPHVGRTMRVVRKGALVDGAAADRSAAGDEQVHRVQHVPSGARFSRNRAS